VMLGLIFDPEEEGQVAPIPKPRTSQELKSVITHKAIIFVVRNSDPTRNLFVCNLFNNSSSARIRIEAHLFMEVLCRAV
jgi:hypothetical protein